MTDETDATTERSPVETAVEHALEALVYAPIGLLFEGSSLLPQLIEKGRNQVTMARMIGKFAVDQGRGEATKAAGRLGDQAAGVLEFIGGSMTVPVPDPPVSAAASPKPAAAAPSPGAARQAARKVAGVGPEPARPAAAKRSSKSSSNGSSAPAADVATLAIPDYDGLSASHVVNRLASLSSAELEAVRRYEAANRGRKTILSKVAQLQSS